MKSIRSQLTFYFVLVFGLMLCAFCIILYNIFALQGRNSIDEAMTFMAVSINEEIQQSGIQPEIFNEISETFIPYSSGSGKFVSLFDDSGIVVLRSTKHDPGDLTIRKDQLELLLHGDRPITTTFEDETSREERRLLLYPITYESKKYIIGIEVYLSELEKTLFRLRLILYISIPLTLILSAILGWIFSNKAYSPITALINDSEVITASNLEKRLPVNDSGDEVARLALTLNGMIERLQQSFTVLKQFTSDASHELRTPLTILKGEIEVALNKQRSAAEYESVLKGNLDEVERLQKIIDSLLTLSRLESGNARYHDEDIDINDLLTDAVTKINSLAQKKNIAVILKLNDTGIDQGHNYFIKGDRSMLLNVFINLFDNAVKYSGTGSRIICSESLHSGTDKIFISVKDNGIGIAEANIHNIFKRFYREDFSRKNQGSDSPGLGLSIVKSIIELHGGNVNVISTPGVETVFTVTLPLFILPSTI